MSGLEITERPSAVRLTVHVQPRASETRVAGLHGTALKIRLHSPPVDGAANEELIEFLARSLGIAKRGVHIISGQSSRTKVVEIEGVSAVSVRALTEGAGNR